MKVVVYNDPHASFNIGSADLHRLPEEFLLQARLYPTKQSSVDLSRQENEIK